MRLEYPVDQDAAEKERYGSGPTPSTSAKTGGAKNSDKKRGQHGRHKVHSKVHAKHKIGPHGEPLEPQTVIGIFSN